MIRYQQGQMPRFWDLLKTQEEKNYLLSFMRAGWDPGSALPDLEPLEEIDRLMREKPRGKLAAILAGAPIN